MGAQPKLKKELSLFGVYTLATGATLSSGFFLLPGLAVAQVGAAVPLSYILAIIPLLPGMLSKIELATAMPRAGGEYYFLDRSLGPWLGTISGIGTWCGLVLKTAFALIGIGAYMTVFFPELPSRPVVAGVAVALGVLNLFGAHKSQRIQTALVVGLLAILAWFLPHGAMSSSAENFAGFWNAGVPQIMATAGMVCVSFMGLTKVASVAEEVQNPERSLPRAILLALLTALVVYAVGTSVLVGVLPVSSLAASLTPAADAAQVLAGRIGAAIMTLAAILAFLSVGNAGILSASRYPLAMSRDDLLPPQFQNLNRHGAPAAGVVLTTGVILLFVTVFDPTGIAKLASTFLLMLFALNCLSVIVMRESHIPSYDPGFRSPWYPWLQLAGIVGPLAFIIAMGLMPMLFATAMIVVGSLWYFYYARQRVHRGGAIFHLCARLGQMRFEGLDRELREILKEKGLRTADPYDEVVARADIIEGADHDSFEDLVRKASTTLSAYLPASADVLYGHFMEGTRIGATPVSKGVALPHLRFPNLDTPLMVIVRSQGGVRIDTEFAFLEHVSDQDIHAVVFLISAEEDAARHLRVLAHVAQQVDRSDFIDAWLACKPDHLRQMFLRERHYLVIDLQSDSRAATLVGRALRDLDMPPNSLIAIIDRGGETLFPHGATELQLGDRLTVVGEQHSIDLLRSEYEPLTPAAPLPGPRPALPDPH